MLIDFSLPHNDETQIAVMPPKTKTAVRVDDLPAELLEYASGNAKYGRMKACIAD